MEHFLVSAYGMLDSGGRAERQMDTPSYQLWFCMYFCAHSVGCTRLNQVIFVIFLKNISGTISKVLLTNFTDGHILSSLPAINKIGD